jgi:RimJ/RimL family protein N-acetyltransferase
MVAEEVSRYFEDKVGLWDGDYLVSEKLLTDELLAYAYLRFKEEKLLPYVFYEGDPGLKWFINEFQRLDVLGCFKREQGGNLALAGLCWLNAKVDVGRVFCKAEAGQGFFSRFHNRREPPIWGKLAAKYAFTALGVNILFGTTPVRNRAAIIAAKRIGFQVLCEIPSYTAWEGKPCAVALSYLTPERLEEMN